jgi:hypothetical protein
MGLVVHYERLFSARYDILPRRRARRGQDAYGLRERRSVEHEDLTFGSRPPTPSR